MFDKGQVPEGMSSSDRTIVEKDAELEVMRKGKSEQRDYFKKLEEGKLNVNELKQPKLLVGKIRDVRKEDGADDLNEEVPEMASLSSRFSFFEHHQEKEDEENQKKRSRKTPPRLSKSHIVSYLKIFLFIYSWISIHTF